MMICVKKLAGPRTGGSMFRSVFIGESRLAYCLRLTSLKRTIPSMASSSLSSESGRVAVVRPQEYV